MRRQTDVLHATCGRRKFSLNKFGDLLLSQEIAEQIPPPQCEKEVSLERQAMNCFLNGTALWKYLFYKSFDCNFVLAKHVHK